MVHIKKLNEMAERSPYSEIRIDFFDENDKMWSVDAWKTNNPNEEGQVLAKISEDGVVYWKNRFAKNSPIVNEYIDDFITNDLETTRKGDKMLGENHRTANARGMAVNEMAEKRNI